MGWFYAVCGASLWVLYQAQPAIHFPYPGVLHASWMSGGFFAAFAAGFLMTAVPKFTGSHLSASWPEILLLLFLFFLPLLGVFSEQTVHLTQASIYLLLLVYFFRRHRARRYNLPDYFMLIPLGLGLGSLGSILLSLGMHPQGRTLAYQAPMLCLIIGVGGRMMPAFLGWKSSNGEVPIRIESPLRLSAPRIQASLVLVSFLLEVGLQQTWPRVFRAIAVFWIGIDQWKIHLRPPTRTRLTTILWLSLLATFLGVTFHALFPEWGVHALHLFFIGGVGSMILGVSTRVSLAHGGHGLTIEKSSPALMIATIALPIAAIARAVAPWGGHYERHLAYAALIWLLVWIAWGFVALPKVFKIKREIERPQI